MRLWLVVLALVMVAAVAILAGLPGEGGSGFTGMMVSERVLEYSMRVEVLPEENMTMGIALQDYELDFGILSRGMTARKRIDIRDPGIPVKVRVWVIGDIAGMAELSREEFLLEGPGSLEVRLRASEPGNSTGRLFISVRNANHRWMGWITPWL